MSIRQFKIVEMFKAGRAACLLALCLPCLSVSAFAQGLVFIDLIAFDREDLDKSSALPHSDTLPEVFFSFQFLLTNLI